MKIRSSFFVALIPLVNLCSSAFAQPTGRSGGAEISSAPVVSAEEVAAAEANLQLVKTQAVLTEPGSLEIPENTKATGQHGEVLVRGLLGADGRFRNLSVAISSRGAELDQHAIANAAAAKFEPARDAEGAPLEILASYPQEFYHYASADGVGLALYGCAQFVRDIDWWSSVYPEKKITENRLYVMTVGLGVMARLGGGVKQALAAADVGGFPNRWNDALQTCRANPDIRFAEAMKSEGAIIDAIAAQHKPKKKKKKDR